MNLDNSNTINIRIAYHFSCVHRNSCTIQKSQPTKDAKWFDLIGNWIIFLLSSCCCTIWNLHVSPKKTRQWHWDDACKHLNYLCTSHWSICAYSVAPLQYWAKWMLRSSVGKTLTSQRKDLIWPLADLRLSLITVLCFFHIHKVLMVLQISCTWMWLWTTKVVIRWQIKMQY